METIENYAVPCEEEEIYCAICYLGYDSQELIAQLQCNSAHAFHKNCIEGWFKTNKSSCPLCREELKGKNVELSDVSDRVTIINNQIRILYLKEKLKVNPPKETF